MSMSFHRPGVSSHRTPPFVSKTLADDFMRREGHYHDHPITPYRHIVDSEAAEEWSPRKVIYGRTMLYFTEFKMSDGTSLSRLEFCKAIGCGFNRVKLLSPVARYLNDNPPISADLMQLKTKVERCLVQEISPCLKELLAAERIISYWEETLYTPPSWDPMEPFASVTDLPKISSSASGAPTSIRSSLPPYFIIAAKCLLEIHARGFGEDVWQVWRVKVPDQPSQIPWYGWPGDGKFLISDEEIIPSECDHLLEESKQGVETPNTAVVPARSLSWSSALHYYRETSQSIQQSIWPRPRIAPLADAPREKESWPEDLKC